MQPRDPAGLSILRFAPGIEVGLARLLPGVGAARLIPLVLDRGPARVVPGSAAAVGLALVEIRAGAVAGGVDAAVVAVIVVGRRGAGGRQRQERGHASTREHLGSPATIRRRLAAGAVADKTAGIRWGKPKRPL